MSVPRITNYKLQTTNPSPSGFTIIEIAITTFVIGTVVVGLFGLFLLSLRSAQESERRVVAVGLANEKMEMARNLPYVDVGTEGGIPAGDIPQVETVSRNGLDYVVSTDIRYVDDPYDGDAAGSNQDEERVTICHKPGTASEQTLEVSASALDAHVAHGDTSGACGTGGEGTGEGDEYNADYKQVRVEVRWNSPSGANPVLLVTFVTPQGVEGGELGGTLDFLTISALGDGVAEADVTLVNDSTDPPTNLTTQTNSEGRLVLPGLPESAGTYELTVAKEGYTTEQTYDVTPTFIPDAEHGHLSMILREVTSKTFFIDLVSAVTVTTKDATNALLPDIAYSFQGTKTIGVDDSNDPVYAIAEDVTTDGSGTHQHTGLPWDSYSINIDGLATGYDIKETSLLLPIQLNPDENLSLDVVLVPSTPLSLHVTVANDLGEPIDNATVHVYGVAGYDQSLDTGVYGQVLFGDLSQTGTYTVDVTAPGYIDTTQTVPVDQSGRIRINMEPAP